MILYHGTTVDIKEIDLQKSKPNKDFGKGFLRTLYTSDTYAKLQDAKTGLYFQSPRYVYDFLRNEIKTGKMS